MIRDDDQGSLFNGDGDPSDDLKGMVRRNDYDTSNAAAASVKKVRNKTQEAVYQAYVSAGEAGLTDGELERLPQFAHFTYSTARKRRTELFQRGEILETERRRPSPASGKPMVVWVIA